MFMQLVFAVVRRPAPGSWRPCQFHALPLYKFEPEIQRHPSWCWPHDLENICNRCNSASIRVARTEAAAKAVFNDVSELIKAVITSLSSTASIMLRWILGQFDALTGDISAALDNALGLLRTSVGNRVAPWPREWTQDAHFPFLDGTESLKNGPLVKWLTLLILAISTMFVLNHMFDKVSSAKRNLGLPALAMEKGWDYAKVLEEGSKKYPNSPYIISYAGYEYVVFPSSSFDEIKRLNASRASMIDWFTTVFWQGWRFLGTDNSARYHTVGIDLARALPSRIQMRQENARAAFDTVLGPPKIQKEWKEVSLWKTVQKLVTLMNALALFGPEIGGDPRWLKATERLHQAIMFGIIGSHLTPRLLRPLAAPILFLPAKLVDWHMASLLRPMVQREMATHRSPTQTEEHSSNRLKSPGNLLSDDSSNSCQLHEGTATKFPLTKWLLDRYSSKNDNLNHLLRDHIVIAFEAATSSAAILYFLLAELAERPDLAQELREEVVQNTDDKGNLPLGYLSELRKMDSFMLDLARATGSSHRMQLKKCLCLQENQD